MAVDPIEMHQVIMPIIDRMVDPLVRRLDQQDADRRQDMASLNDKIDSLSEIAHQIGSHSVAQQGMEKRLEAQEASTILLNSRMNVQEGRNQIIAWLLGLVGAPVMVALALAGIAKLFSIKIGG